MGPNSKSMRRAALICLLISSGIFILWGSYLAAKPPAGMGDFKAVYYGARCLFDHRDPYNRSEFESVYFAEGGQLPSDPADWPMFRSAVTVLRNPPSALFVVAPLAMLPWGVTCALWTMLSAAGLALAAFLMWRVAERRAPRLALLLICFLIANSIYVIALGNTAGAAVGLCVIAVWCLMEERFVAAGILCLAVALAIKPHDAGFVWAYFLLAGGAYRKRALQTLLVVGVLVLVSILWVSHVSPHWSQELHANLLTTEARGTLNDPGPASDHFFAPDMVINLQSAIAIFRDDPRVYNTATYLVCGVLLLLGAVRTLRTRFSQSKAWFALAAIAALSMLPVYHRLHDAKLLLLTLPACAMLWAGGGPLKWTAGLLNTAAIVVTADVPSTILMLIDRSLHGHVTGFTGKLLDLILLRPAAPILLATGILYLWVYLRRTALLKEGASAIQEIQGVLEQQISLHV
ncbi:MAG: glycosyltransferase family 87 protein [Terracidiphilus sp.]